MEDATCPRNWQVESIVFGNCNLVVLDDSSGTEADVAKAVTRLGIRIFRGDVHESSSSSRCQLARSKNEIELKLECSFGQNNEGPVQLTLSTRK